MDPRLKVGDVVKHFKRELIPAEQRSKSSEYLYKICGIATHTETRERMVIYMALYQNSAVSYGNLYARPYDMFMSKVDHFKYPSIKQTYRFEPYKRGD